MTRNRRVLLLNRGESLVDVIDWQTAVCLLVKGNAHVPYGYDDYYKIPISLASAERMKEEGDFEVEIEEEGEVRRGFFLLPTAVVLVEYVHIPYKAASVNKKNVLKRDKNKCGYCGKHLTESTGSVDHIVPRSRWQEMKRKGRVKGKHPNNWKNVVASCKDCNCKKDDKTPEEVGMKLKIRPYVPSRDFLILHGIDTETFETWSRWICFDDLK
jgi:5-methylcytosine-specific restriction endonuclease McrA